MTLQELKTWIEELPEEFLSYHVVNATVMSLDEAGEEYSIRLDKPVTTLTVDEENQEILIMNDADSGNNQESLDTE